MDTDGQHPKITALTFGMISSNWMISILYIDTVHENHIKTIEAEASNHQTA